MKIYIVRHAIAVEGNYPNDDRPLSAKGRKKFKETISGLRKVIPKSCQIWSSPLSRAKETGVLLKKGLKIRTSIKQVKELLPNNSVTSLAKKILRAKNIKDLVLVSHQPLIGKVVSKICKIAPESLTFKKGSLCVLQSNAKSKSLKATIELYLAPNDIIKLG